MKLGAKVECDEGESGQCLIQKEGAMGQTAIQMENQSFKVILVGTLYIVLLIKHFTKLFCEMVSKITLTSIQSGPNNNFPTKLFNFVDLCCLINSSDFSKVVKQTYKKKYQSTYYFFKIWQSNFPLFITTTKMSPIVNV